MPLLFSSFPTSPTLLRSREACLLALCLLLLAAAVAGPVVTQPDAYHDFADHRSWGGLRYAGDVLSNLPFAAWGLWGLWLLRTRSGVPAVQHCLMQLFFAGLVLTSACSAGYHLQPDDAGLLFDRCGMAVAFAGLLGLAAAQRVGARAGAVLAAAVLVTGPASVGVWATSGNLLAWVVLQGGGLMLLLWFSRLPVLADALPVRLGWVIALYAAAKLLELQDHAVFDGLGHWVSGHSLKHVVASCAAWPVVAALLAHRRAACKAGQNHAAPGPVQASRFGQ